MSGPIDTSQKYEHIVMDIIEHDTHVTNKRQKTIPPFESSVFNGSW